MTDRSDTQTAAPSSALTAFLRGVERRGEVLAQLQCGDAEQAERALAATLRAFLARAGDWPMASWPNRFWALLVATPALHAPARQPRWAPGLEALAPLAAEDRLALLLRIVVGLDEAAAADVLGTPEAEYRHALARACPRDAAGHPDAVAWRALAEAAQRELRDVSPERLARLAELRDAAAAGTLARTLERAPAASPAATAPAPRPSRPQRAPGRRRWIALAVLLLAAAVAVTAWSLRRAHPALPPEPVSQAPAGVLHVVDAAPVLVEELPAEDLDVPDAKQVATADPGDAAMLADPEFALARQADFYAWSAAGGPVPPDESEPRALGGPDMAAAGLETVSDDE